MSSVNQTPDSALAEMPEAVRALDKTAEKRVTPCGDGHLIWRVWGEGEPLVLFHGGSGSWTHWLKNIPELSRHYRLLVPDLPGLGDSDVPPRPFDNDDLPGSMMMLAGLLRHGVNELLGAETRYHLTGFSFGSILGGHLAATEGKRLKAFVLVGSAAMGLTRKGMRAELQRVPRGASPAEGIEVQRRNLSIHMLSSPERVDDVAAWLQWRNVASTRLRGRRVAPTDLLARQMPKIEAPLNGIWGRLDVYAPERMDSVLELLRETDPAAQLEIIEDAGHWVAYEKPNEFNSVLLDILAARSA